MLCIFMAMVVLLFICLFLIGFLHALYATSAIIGSVNPRLWLSFSFSLVQALSFFSALFPQLLSTVEFMALPSLLACMVRTVAQLLVNNALQLI